MDHRRVACVGTDDDALVRDMDQAAAAGGVDELAGELLARRVLEAADADPAALVDPPGDAELGRSGCRSLWRFEFVVVGLEDHDLSAF